MGRRGWALPEAERRAAPTPPGSGHPTRPARLPGLTGSGALHSAGVGRRRVSAGGGLALRPGASREGGAEAEAGAGPGIGGRGAEAGRAAGAGTGGGGSGRGDQACGGAEPPEPQFPQKMHAHAGSPERAEGADPMRPRYRIPASDAGPARGGRVAPLCAATLRPLPRPRSRPRPPAAFGGSQLSPVARPSPSTKFGGVRLDPG